MWCLIFLFLILMLIIYPFIIKIEIKFNLIKLKGVFYIKILNKFVLLFKFRIKNGYVYIYHKNKERKEKIIDNNPNIIFFLNLIKQIYFREQLVNLEFRSNFGYSLDSCITATGCGYVDVITKCVFAKIKNNKKMAHIFVLVEPKYNEDILNIKFDSSIRISIFDILYSFIYAKIYFWRSYGRRKKRKAK